MVEDKEGMASLLIAKAGVAVTDGVPCRHSAPSSDGVPPCGSS
ncbi:hypothetical protein [Sphingomonas abietis]|uniref:Uncharacterized protein n=1 Tax=Sphingomonas abietis TaxID=3012344 RepID=A0ABY7NY44_9SPHN|nr:hypothetical protein [Sphingomonas abietis]WBO24276.1 hypothetical protein PBT88_09325 [Sphingomonas abietis]